MLLTSFKYKDTDNNDVSLDDATSVQISLGLKVKNNSMTVKLRNDPVDVTRDGTIRHKWVDDDGTCTFKAIKATSTNAITEELINIYAEHEYSDPTLSIESFLYNLFTGVITMGKVIDKQNEQRIELKCKDRNTVVLDALTKSQSFDASDGYNAPKIIKAMIQHLGDNVASNQWAYNSSGTLVQGSGFLIDAALFSDRIKRTSTTTSTTTNKLVDSGATFTSQVEVGDMIRNTTSNKYCIINAIDNDTQLTVSKNIFESGDGYQISNGFIQDKRPDGSNFPALSFAQLDKPVIEYASKLSQISYTNSITEYGSNSLVIKRGMLLKLDRRNRFHWYYPEDTPEFLIKSDVATAISPDMNFHYINSSSLENEIDDKINFIIFTAGTDMENDTIKSYKYAQFTGIPNGKECKRDWSIIGRYMKYMDFMAGNITRNSYDDYNYPTSYPMTPKWDNLQRSVANDSAYNTNFEQVALATAYAFCEAIFQQRANPRWKGKLQLRGLAYQPGDLIQYTDKRKGINNLKLRINHVMHILQNMGWTTTLDVEEDEPELILGG